MCAIGGMALRSYYALYMLLPLIISIMICPLVLNTYGERF